MLIHRIESSSYQFLKCLDFIVEDTWHFFVTQLEFHNSSTGDYNMRFAKLIACVSTCSMKHSIVMKITTPFLYPLTLQIMPIQAKNNLPVQANSFDNLKLHNVR